MITVKTVCIKKYSGYIWLLWGNDVVSLYRARRFSMGLKDMKKKNSEKGKITTFIMRVKKVFIEETIVKVLAYAIPVFLAGQLYTWCFNPDLNITDIQGKVMADKMVLSDENSSLQQGKAVTIPDELNENQEINLSDYAEYSAPEIQLHIKGRGKVQRAYIIYKQNEVEKADEWMPQQMEMKSGVKHYELIPQSLDVVCSYVNQPNIKTKELYLVFIGKDGQKETYAGHLDMDEEKIDIKKMEEIYAMVPYQESYWGMNKIEIQEDYEVIRKMDL